jgi:hypothetical protein
MAKAKGQQLRSSKAKGRTDLDKLAMSDSDNDLEMDDGLLKVHDGVAAGSDDGLDEEAVYGLDDSDLDEDESEDEDNDSEDALEEALMRGGKQAQRKWEAAAAAAGAAAAAARAAKLAHGM